MGRVRGGDSKAAEREGRGGGSESEGSESLGATPVQLRRFPDKAHSAAATQLPLTESRLTLSLSVRLTQLPTVVQRQRYVV